MARLLVADDNGTPFVEIRTDDEVVHTAVCRAHPDWTPGCRPSDGIEDVLAAAEIHVDRYHSGRPLLVGP
jgi:hypothetical protein